MRAVADAQILLERAVRILNDKPPMEKDTGERLAEGLQRHDLDAVVVAVDTKDCPIAQARGRAITARRETRSHPAHRHQQFVGCRLLGLVEGRVKGLDRRLEAAQAVKTRRKHALPVG